MAEIYKFFNSAPGDERWYFASDFADYFGNVLSSGLLHKDGTPNLQVKVVEGELKTRVDIGEALMQGYQYENTLPLTLEHGLPEPNLDRIDRIVLRLDKRNDARYIKLFIKQGESAVNPSPPQLQRDNYVHELSLAQVRVRKNTSSLNVADVKDERMIEDLCGIVYSLISVPTTVFQQQFDTWLADYKITNTTAWEAWQNQEKADFEAWLDSIKDLLDDNVAAKLAAQITAVDAKVGDTANLKTQNKTNVVSAINELFTNANNLKKDWADVVGAPLNPNDTSAQLKDKTQAIKNKGANHLTTKGVTANGNESLDTLMEKIAEIETRLGPGNTPIISRGDLESEWISYPNHGEENRQKISEIKMLRSGIYRVSFSLQTSGSATSSFYARIYVNDLPVGIVRTTRTSNDYTLYVEDISIEADDLLQLFVFVGVQGSGYVRKMTIGVETLGNILL